MKIYMNECYSLVAVIIVFIVFGSFETQGQYLQDINGKPMVLKFYEDVEGSPLLFDDWKIGMVKLGNNKTFSKIALKYDQQQDELFFKGQTEEILAFVDPVKEFTINVNDLSSISYRSGIKADGLDANAFYQVIADGTNQLLKKTTKYVESSKGYGTTPVKKFMTSVKYYLVIANKATPIKLDKKSILAALTNHQNEVEEFVKANKINFKSDADLSKLITYYNSI